MQRQERNTIDPITLEIWWSRLIAVADESATALLRTAFSTIVRESNDFATVLMNSKGESVAECTGGIPAFAGIVPRTARHFIQKFGRENFSEGDCLITNNPWLATGHLPDITIITPIFYRGSLVAFAGAAAHSPDIGGTHGAAAREIYEEGICIPPTHLYRRGRRNDEMLELLLNNVRVPEQVLGDLDAQVTANDVCRRNLVDFLETTGQSNLERLSAAIHQRSENAMREAIAKIPDGEYSASVKADGVEGAPTRIDCRINVKGSELTIDYTGSSPQIQRGINCTMNYTQAYSMYPLKCALDPFTRRNEGSYRPIRVSAPEGSIVNARYPAPVGARHLTGHLLSCAIYQALSSVIPGRVIADSGGTPAMRVRFSGRTAARKAFSQILFASGGMGASLEKDGLSTTAFPTNSGAGSIEALEAVAPLLVRKKEYRTDSGGAGRQRGGLGQICEIENVAGEPVQVALIADRQHHPALGFGGGQPGAPTAALLADGTALPLKTQISLVPGQYISLHFAGGGGYGLPIERDLGAIAADIDDGFVSPEAAQKEYGFSRGD
ncbi:hydantoinase B/oxoprolinase family protein [Paraburkholderia heleia]|uniref:hydantoinase B/oxoprolinase family protein n=1 Tax=Paraburkholderia heleia TaxID=634127 RepID=UPI0031E1FA02